MAKSGCWNRLHAGLRQGFKSERLFTHGWVQGPNRPPKKLKRGQRKQDLWKRGGTQMWIYMVRLEQDSCWIRSREQIRTNAFLWRGARPKRTNEQFQKRSERNEACRRRRAGINVYMNCNIGTRCRLDSIMQPNPNKRIRMAGCKTQTGPHEFTKQHLTKPNL